AFELPCRKRNAGRAAQVGERASIVAVQRLFEPREPAILDIAAKLLGLDRPEHMVAVRHELNVRPYRVAHQSHAPYVLTPTVRMGAHDHLETLVALGEAVARGLLQLIFVVFAEPESTV